MKARVILFVVASLILSTHETAAEPPGGNPVFRDKLIADLIKQLESEKFAERQEATDLLRAIGRPAVEPLKTLLDSKPSLEVATRARNLIRQLTREKTANQKAREILAQPIDFPDGIPANSTIKDVIDSIHDKLRSKETPLTFIFEKEAFKSVDVPLVEDQLVSLPKTTGVSGDKILRLLLEQIKGNGSAGTYVVEDGVIRITPSNPALVPGTVPRVDVALNGESLEEALSELAEESGQNIVFDPRQIEKGQRPTKLTMRRVSIRTAVRLLAHMADLKAVVFDDVIYVTSKEGARELETQPRKEDGPLVSRGTPANEPKGELKDK
jgi:hypothetical protein